MSAATRSMTRNIDPTGRRRLVTPEGVDLSTDLADIGARIAAFALDLAIIYGTIFLLSLALIAAGIGALGMGAEGSGEVVAALWFVGMFLLRYFYFTILESGRRGATFGKRLLKIRVASRTSPRLDANKVFARNAMRELELFLPLQLVASGGEGVDGLITTAALLWACVFLFFPLFNRDRMRAGDLIAGTWVVRAPRPQLLDDLSETAPIGDFAFTPAQVDAYGVHELHVLEDVLRTADPDTEREVAARIRAKVDWRRGPTETDRAFLDAYYRALRERLEQRLMFGVRREDKHDTR